MLQTLGHKMLGPRVETRDMTRQANSGLLPSPYQADWHAGKGNEQGNAPHYVEPNGASTPAHAAAA